MYTELPLISTSTPVERIAALQTAKDLLTSTPGKTSPAIFGGGSTETVHAPETFEMIRLAEYITTGHDYRDTHPEGKRRPIIKNITKVTVMAPAHAPEPTREDVEHFLHHVENGDFADFIEEAISHLKETVKDGEAEEAEDRPKAPGFAPDFDL